MYHNLKNEKLFNIPVSVMLQYFPPTPNGQTHSKPILKGSETQAEPFAHGKGRHGSALAEKQFCETRKYKI